MGEWHLTWGNMATLGTVHAMPVLGLALEAGLLMRPQRGWGALTSCTTGEQQLSGQVILLTLPPRYFAPMPTYTAQRSYY